MKLPFFISLALVLLFFNFKFSAAWRHFYRGRHFTKKRVSAPAGVQLPSDQWFEQVLDHFNPADTRIWKQRYFTNDTFYKKDGPIFLMVGGEGEAQPIWMVEGAWIQWARQFNALCLHLEHRYYGQSHPTTNMSVKNLQYLSSQQALADLAYFIQAKNKEYNLINPKWILFGGSYPGSLTAWFRLKYPHLAYAGVASSAPLVATVNFQDYLAVVTKSLETSKAGRQCTEEIRSANADLQKLLESPEGRKKVEKTLGLCDKLTNATEKDIATLFENLAGNFEGVVQYNKDNREFEGAKGANITIDVVCDIMTDKSVQSPLERYAKVNTLWLKTRGDKCLDYLYENFLKDMRAIKWNSSASEGGRQWTYQTCAEFGYYQSSDLSDQPFGHVFPVEYFVDQCKDIFGAKFNLDFVQKAVGRTNTFYGGLDLESERIILPNGSIDPWHALGLTKDRRSLFINGTAHCADMYPPSDKDSPELKTARENILKQLKEWMAN